MRLASSVFIPFLFLYQSILGSSQNSKCPASFQCGRYGEVGFPFSNTTNPECGLCSLNCTGPQPTVKWSEDAKWNEVHYLNYSTQTIDFKDHTSPIQVLEGNSCYSIRTIPLSPFLNISIPEVHRLFKCKHKPDPIIPSDFFHEFRNYTGCKNYDLYFYDDPHKCLPPLLKSLSTRCFLVRLPNTRLNLCMAGSLNSPGDAIFRGKWKVFPECLKCHSNGGQCQIDQDRNFICGHLKTESNTGRKIGIGLSCAAGSMIVVILLFVLHGRRSMPQILSWKKKTGISIDFEGFLKNHMSHYPKRYNFKDVKTMTKAFKDKLGQGGYGTVFKGTLNDGQFVAVKVLIETKGNGEEFINEVASISRTSHVNIVGLLGYCFDGSKRALIYEFMTNGSLDKYIYGEKSQYSQLEWETLYQIAVGTARGLEYLHRGCSTRILHFDIKPHNILLDKDFCPKISDFGLARLCPTKESVISMLGARGTAGYIAPEVFCRSFGGISHKSDVYSYGMMILEMVGRRKNIDIGVNHTSEIYFPSWIYKRIELDEDLGLHGVVTQTAGELTKKMILVGLWCIQTNPQDRPSMHTVLEMLESSLQVLSLPPKPTLCSPPREPTSSSVN